MKSKTSQETERSLRKFLEPLEKPKVIHTDISLEFKSCESLSWNHHTSTHHRSETYGIAGRAVRRIKEWTSAVLLQSGSGEKGMLLLSAKCSRPPADGKIPYERRFGEPFISLVQWLNII